MKMLRYMILFFLLFLSGCQKKELVPAPAELFLLTDGTTSDGLTVGDGEAKFREAYHEYEILFSSSHSMIPDEKMPIGRIPYDQPVSTMIANFFIDGTPTSPEEICASQDLAPSELLGFLSSPAFLREHEVIYRYLLFRWDDSAITQIISDEINYNESYEVPSA